MPDPTPQRGAADDPQRLSAWIDAYLDGHITDHDMAALDEALRTRPAARAAFFDAVHTHHALVESLHPATESASATPTAPRPTSPKPRAAAQRGPGVFRPIYALAAALLLAAAAVTVYLATAPDLNPDTPDTPNDQPVATILDTTEGVTLLVDGQIVTPGSEVRGGAVNLDTGSAEFRLSNGVTTALHGPTRLSIDGPMAATLLRGAATFDCPPNAVGYTVRLPGGARVVDLGTRFSVWVGPDDAAHVHVLTGSVMLKGADHKSELRLTVGQSGAVQPSAAPARVRPFAAAIPLGNLFDDAPGTPLAVAVATDTYQAPAIAAGLAIAHVGGETDAPGPVQSIAPDTRIDLRPLGWLGGAGQRVPANDAWSPLPNEGGIRTLGRRAPLSLERTEDGIGMHADQRVTFDLDAIRRAGALPADASLRLVVDRAGLNDTATSRGAVHLAAVAFDERTDALAALVNGQPVAARRVDGVVRFTDPIPPALRHGGAAFDLPIPPGARYLTLIAASAGNNENDHAVFSGARLVIDPSPTTPSDPR